MKRLLLAGAAALVIWGPAFAQQSSSSDATAGSNAQQQQGQVQAQGNNNSNGGNYNGGSSANNGGVQVGPDISKSNAASEANSASLSKATGGNATGGNSSATNGAANAGNTQALTVNNVSPAHTTADVKSVPNVYAPALTTTLTDTCMGSSSLGGSGMGVGVTIGTTWEDRNCNRRLYAREVASLTGDREAARAILCQDKDVYKAFEDVGRPCPTPEHAESPSSFVPPPPPPPPNQYLYAAPPPPAPPPPPPAAEQQSSGTMAPIPNPEPKYPRN